MYNIPSAYGHIPDVRIPAFFSKAGPNGRALFLYDGALICNRFRGSHIADELFDYGHCVSFEGISRRGIKIFEVSYGSSSWAV